MVNLDTEDRLNGNEIAIIGMAGCFPKAKNIEEFWQNLYDGVESISFFSSEELASSGVPSVVLNDPDFVPAKGVLEDIDLFDAAFFGYSPREAAIIDPQQRLFLEYAWQALENAGYDAQTYTGLIGAYAGLNMNTYYSHLLFSMFKDPDLGASIGEFEAMLANDKDYLTTRVSYKLNLRGPSINVQTACSTSLVAVHLACQSLLNGECDMALAGGVSAHVSQMSGYYYQEGSISSPDGHCRAFDAKAQGTVSGNGLGIVVLKRLAEALVDGDCIHAVIKGTACNNDGALKVGYTAPSVQGQAEVIVEALSMAGISPETVSYIETHGTATPIGDPIEITALTQAFGTHTSKKNFCAIGSVKTNMGHLGAAAGIAGLLKTTLALKHQMLPPSLHFEVANPQIDFANSPFYVNSMLSPWKRGETPLRAGVSSFGIGGTNVHVILEEPPHLKSATTRSVRPWQLVVLSAKTETALFQTRANLAGYLQQHPELDLADVAYTLQVGRSAFNHRQVLVSRDLADTVHVLQTSGPTRLLSMVVDASERSVAFLFPGQGAQYVHMGQELYQSEPVFRAEVDRCAELLMSHLGLDIRTMLYPEREATEEASLQLSQTWLTQPALFVLEYALARLWEAWGIHPTAMIGHSIGEYVAACLAGIFSLEAALRIVAIRGRLMQQLAGGAMLAVPLPKLELGLQLAVLTEQSGELLSIAAVNSPTQCVVSGPTGMIKVLEQQLQAQGVDCQRLQTSHAFHSAMVEPILAEFGAQVSAISLQAPQLRYISNVTGTWITALQATDPNYWVRHLRQEVRFAEGIETLLREPDLVLLEVGPGRTLSTFAKQQMQQVASHVIVSSLRRATEVQSDVSFILTSLGRLWLAGVKVEWPGLYIYEQYQRLPLPTYPFERQRYWIEAQEHPDSADAERKSFRKKPNIADWFYFPVWKQSVSPDILTPRDLLKQRACWLVFLDECRVGSQIVRQLGLAGQSVITVRQDKQYRMITPGAYAINPHQREDYVALLTELCSTGSMPEQIIHLWNVTPNESVQAEQNSYTTRQELSFYSLLFLAQAIGEQNRTESICISIVSNQLQEVTGEERLCPEKSLLLGPCKVIPQEYPHITCRSIDVSLPETEGWQREQLIDQIITECMTVSPTSVVAYRGKYRWVQTFESVQLNGTTEEMTRLREEGVYLITGGLGGMGVTLAEYLTQAVRAKLILIGRSEFPAHHEWEQWLTAHDEQDELSCKIRKLKALEELGAEVLVVSVDVTNQEQMQTLIDHIHERFGSLHGVIHTAGIVSGGMLQLKTPEVAANVLAPKVVGTQVLEKVLQDIKLDFLILCSSLSSIQGGIGQVDYCAASAFLDTFAHYNTCKCGTPTTSINWDAWQEMGIAANIPLPLDLKEQWQENPKRGILPREGMNVFSRLLGRGHPQVLVSTVDLQAAIKPSYAPTTASAPEKLEREYRSKSAHPRPILAISYVAPRNELEQRVANIWEMVLGIDQIGIHDNFFDLGGHSLLATQIMSRLRHSLQVDLPLRRLLEKPTVAQLVPIIVESLKEQKDHTIPVITQADRGNAAQLLANLASLSDEEVDALLQKSLMEE